MDPGPAPKVAASTPSCRERRGQEVTLPAPPREEAWVWPSRRALCSWAIWPEPPSSAVRLGLAHPRVTGERGSLRAVGVGGRTAL